MLFNNKKFYQDKSSVTFSPPVLPLQCKMYRDKICVYDEHPIAGGDIQYRAPDSQSGYTTPFDNIIR